MGELAYQRCRFVTGLPTDRRYTAGHYWLQEVRPGVWRVGLTAWATRMLGDPVEHAVDIQPGEAVEVGQVIGWLEAFKALTDLYAVAEGRFVGVNPALKNDVDLVGRDCFGAGWIYEVEGKPEATAMDAEGYALVLDATIDEVRAGGGESPAEGEG
jgi:glycine cleavage system H protein